MIDTKGHSRALTMSNRLSAKIDLTATIIFEIVMMIRLTGMNAAKSTGEEGGSLEGNAEQFQRAIRGGKCFHCRVLFGVADARGMGAGVARAIAKGGSE